MTFYTVCNADVRFGSKAEVKTFYFDVRFTPESGHSIDAPACLPQLGHSWPVILCLGGNSEQPGGIGSFAGDLPEAEQKLVWATQAAPVPDLFNQKVDGVAWRSKPSWYIVATEDRTIQPELERFVAKRMGATTVELRSSHVPMLSQPQAVLDVIRNAAKAIQKSKAA